MAMRYTRFGSTDVEVSEISFGGAAISGEGAGYGFGHISKKESIDLLHWTLERGINLYDTAPIYGFRESEKRMGEAFKGRRDQVFLVSKCGISWHENMRVNLDNSAHTTRKMLENSLRDLRTDFIDLYMVHYPDSRVDIRETMTVLSKAKKEGKIRFIGLCNTNPLEYEMATQVDRIDVIQTELNLFKTESFNPIKEIVARDDLGFMSWGSLEKGILSGSVTRDRKFDEVDCRKTSKWWKQMNLEGRFKVMDELNPLLKSQDLGGIDLAIAYCLSQTENSTVLCGGRSRLQWQQLMDHRADRVGLGLIDYAIGLVSKYL